MPVAYLVTYNATLPISQLLVPEMFSKIIHLALDDDPPAIETPPIHNHQMRNALVGGAPYRPKRRLGVAVNASHVCFAWRTLCIGTPTIWARQIGKIPKAIPTLLARSSRALLDITSYGLDLACHWQSAPAIDSSRVRSIQWGSRDIIPILYEILDGDLLYLEALDIGVKHANDRENLERLGSLGNVPRLTKLNLHGVFLSGSFPLLSRITLYRSPITLSQLLGALRSAPLLQFFELMYVDLDVDFPGNLASVYPCHPNPIRLRHLQYLILESTSDNIAIEEGFHILLDILRVRPKDISVVVGPCGMSLRLLAMCLWIGLRSMPLTFLRLEECLDMWVTEPRMAHLPPEHSSSVSDLQIGHIDEVEDDYWEQLRSLDMKELHRVTEIELCVYVGSYQRSVQDIRHFLRALPNVTSCWITNGTVTVDNTVGCSALLNELSLKDGPSAASNYPWPLLKVLGINVDELDCEVILTDIQRTLTCRMEIGYPKLQTLSLPVFRRPSADDVMSAVAARLEQLADTVRWGCQEVDSKDEEDSGDSGSVLREPN